MPTDLREPRSADKHAATKVDYEHRTTVNLMAVIAIMLIGAGIYLTVNYISESHKLERCVSTGRRDCFVVPGQPVPQR